MKLGIFIEVSLKTKIPQSSKIIQMISNKQEYGVLQETAAKATTTKYVKMNASR